tara:strand:+ start:264 stop:524 length:261 start_codon:yes stop_codon:yes gene_type:complete
MVQTRYTAKNNLPEYSDTQKEHGYKSNDPSNVCASESCNKISFKEHKITKNEEIAEIKIKKGNVVNMHIHFYNEPSDQEEYVFVRS